MILVTGGTGFVGQEVVRELIALGHRVRLLVRDPHRAASFASHPQVELVKGDVLKPETLPPALVHVQSVVHLVGIIAETSKVTFEQAHTQATLNLLLAVKEAGVTRWIQMSAAGTRPDARSRYHLSKWAAEELVRRSALDWTIFRPSLIYGHDDRDRLLNMLRLVLSPPFDFIQTYTFPLLNGGRAHIQPVSVREVGLCFAHAVSKDASVGRTFDLVGPVALTWREMVSKVALALGKKAIYEEIPILILLRALLWLVVALVPILIIVGLVTDRVTLPIAEIAAFLWCILLFLTSRWRQLILFSIPSALIWSANRVWDKLVPRSLRFQEQLYMAEEDNVGDPLPAAQTFGYTPESFEQGVATIFRIQSHQG